MGEVTPHRRTEGGTGRCVGGSGRIVKLREGVEETSVPPEGRRDNAPPLQGTRPCAANAIAGNHRRCC
jgi:hypothetical protein